VAKNCRVEDDLVQLQRGMATELRKRTDFDDLADAPKHKTYLAATSFRFAALRNAAFGRVHYCKRSAGIGTGMLNVLAATPIPPWQVLGG